MSAAQDSTTKPTSKEEWIKAEDGHEIFTKTWYAVGTPVASVVFVHGLGEHIVRKCNVVSFPIKLNSSENGFLLTLYIFLHIGYDHVFEEFNKAGFQVSSFDQRGFGQTGNGRGFNIIHRQCSFFYLGTTN